MGVGESEGRGGAGLRAEGGEVEGWRASGWEAGEAGRVGRGEGRVLLAIPESSRERARAAAAVVRLGGGGWGGGARLHAPEELLVLCVDGGELPPACRRVHRAGGAVAVGLREVDRVDVRRHVPPDLRPS